MPKAFSCVVLALTLGVLQALAFSVPFSANTPDFAVEAVTSAISVACTATVRVSCQAVRVDGNNQELVGEVKIIDEVSSEYLDIEVFALSQSAVLVCFATGDIGTKCSQLAVDDNFGLIGGAEKTVDVCSSEYACNGLSIANTSVANTAAICYSFGDDKGACSLLESLSSARPTTRRLLTVDELWIGPVSLLKVPDGPLVLCVIQQVSEGEEEYDEDINDAICRVLSDTTLQFNGKPALRLGAGEIVSSVYVGEVDGRHYLTVCYLSPENDNVYCGAVFYLAGSLFVSSRDVFKAPYEDGLAGLKLSRLSDDPSSLIAMGCLTTPDVGSEQLICSTIDISPSGLITVDENEMVSDENGFYYQNVPKVLASDEETGVYLEAARYFAAMDSGPEAPVINDVTVLPDFMGLLKSSVSSPVSVNSVGCMQMGFNEMDKARFCVATGARLARPPPPVNPFPPGNYCNQKQKWQCDAREDKCAWIIVNNKGKCVSKYACTAQKNANQCNKIIAAGGFCKFEGKKCLGSYVWDPESMCQASKTAAVCKSSPGCAWAEKACHPAPYCGFTKKAQCSKNANCKWVNDRCGVKGVV